MKSWVGRSILVIGILHTLVGVVAFHDVLTAILREGLLNTIGLKYQPEREAAFWFMYTGFSLLIIGGLVVWVERNRAIEWTHLLSSRGAFFLYR